MNLSNGYFCLSFYFILKPRLMTLTLSLLEWPKLCLIQDGFTCQGEPLGGKGSSYSSTVLNNTHVLLSINILLFNRCGIVIHKCNLFSPMKVKISKRNKWQTEVR